MVRSIACAGLLLAVVAAFAEETILSLKSDIVVRNDGSLIVTESITVRAEEYRIRCGIYPDLPTGYRHRHGNNVAVD